MASWDDYDEPDELTYDRIHDPGRDPDDFELAIALERIAGRMAGRVTRTPDEPNDRKERDEH
jgi:hypothetical protein